MVGAGVILAWWNSLRTSLWFVPTLCVSVAVLLSFIMPEVDHWIDETRDELPGWVFGGSSDGARSILSTVAGSLITIVGVVFSITIVVLQQASTQFTPRVMGNFIRHTGVQLVLGFYLATFLYSLLVLRYVRGEDAQAEEFIPRLSIVVSLFLAAACLGFLVYFIHHMATSLQASMVIANVEEEFKQDVERLYPEHVGDPLEDESQSLEQFRREYLSERTNVVRADHSGYLQSIDDETILRHAGYCHAIAILPQIGDYIIRGTPLLEVPGSVDFSAEQCRKVLSGLILGKERSRFQDPLFSIRQLVDIALKALSTGVNDPTTARNSISTLGASLAELRRRQFPNRIRIAEADSDNGSRTVTIWTNRPDYSEFVDIAFSEIRRTGIDNAAVTAHLVETIGDLAVSVDSSERAAPLLEQLELISRELREQAFTSRDEREIRERIERATRSLSTIPVTSTQK